MLPSRKELSDLLGLLYDAAADPTLWAPFIEQLARRTNATSAAFLMHDFQHARHTASSAWRLDPDLNRLYQERYYAKDVWAHKLAGQPNRGAYISESLCPLPELKVSEFYNELLVKADIEHAIFAIPENSASCLSSVSLYRNRSRPEFTDTELDIMRLVAPHIQRAFKLHFTLSELKAHSDGVDTALDMLPSGVILFDSGGLIVLMNRTASALLEEKDGLLTNHAGLRAEHPAESSILTESIRLAASTSNGKSLFAGATVLVSRHKRPPLQVLVSPIRNSGMQTSKRIAAIAFINDPLQHQRPTNDFLRMQYGLTPAECRVALLLSDGHALRRIAEMVGVTGNTVRSQIKSIFSKTGVRRQGELIRLLLNSAGPTVRPSPGS